MEFTRVSPKRNGALVVCLDAVHGVGCATSAIASVRDRIGAAVTDLARRERASEARIGAVCLASGHTSGTIPEVVEEVRRWCLAGGRAGAVWPGLASDFEAHLGEAFPGPRGVGRRPAPAGGGEKEGPPRAQFRHRSFMPHFS